MRLLAIITVFQVFAVIESFAEKKSVDRFFNTEKLRSASYSICAIDAISGEKICDTPPRSLSTASVMKLITTAVALDMLGPQFTFTTSLEYTGTVDTATGILKGNLYLKGGADPAFYSSWFEEHYRSCFEDWILALKKLGIRKVEGKLLTDLSALDRMSVPGGWAWDDIGNYYGAGVYALSYRDNLYEIHFASSPDPGAAVSIRNRNPDIEGLSLENRVVGSTIGGDQTIVYGAPGGYDQYVEGTIPVGQADFIVKAAMPDPPSVAAAAFLAQLKESGIQVSGSGDSGAGRNDGERMIVANIVSPALAELIVPLNKESLNLYAEHLLREIGRKFEGKPTLENGLLAYRHFLKEKSIDAAGFFPSDGSGLSRGNALTAQTLAGMLKYMYDSPNRKAFFDSLPLAGEDGTLRNSFRGTPLEKNVRAKTGSMERVRSMAGSMKTRSGKTILFAVLINNFDLSPAETSRLMETILLSFYDESDK